MRTRPACPRRKAPDPSPRFLRRVLSASASKCFSTFQAKMLLQSTVAVTVCIIKPAIMTHHGDADAAGIPRALPVLLRHAMISTPATAQRLHQQSISRRRRGCPACPTCVPSRIGSDRQRSRRPCVVTCRRQGRFGEEERYSLAYKNYSLDENCDSQVLNSHKSGTSSQTFCTDSLLAKLLFVFALSKTLGTI